MVAIPDFKIDPTLAAMHAAVEDRGNSEPKRDYLGASILGHKCERFVWYNLNHAEKSAPIEARGFYAIEDGHRTEQLVIERLRLISGITVWDKDETGEQFGFKDGRFSGHLDGVILGLLQAPKTPHVLEVKCCNEKKFNELIKLKDKHGEKAALEQWDYTYYVQGMIYCGKMDIDRHYLLVATPGGRNIVSCRTDFNKDFYQSMLQKKDRIISSTQAPERISSYKEFYECKFCRFSDFCWKDA